MRLRACARARARGNRGVGREQRTALGRNGRRRRVALGAASRGKQRGGRGKQQRLAAESMRGGAAWGAGRVTKAGPGHCRSEAGATGVVRGVAETSGSGNSNSSREPSESRRQHGRSAITFRRPRRCHAEQVAKRRSHASAPHSFS
mgnify:CR=1 FL=1